MEHYFQKQHKTFLGISMKKLKLKQKNALPALSLATANVAKMLSILLLPLNFAIWILNLALIFTLMNKT